MGVGGFGLCQEGEVLFWRVGTKGNIRKSRDSSPSLRSTLRAGGGIGLSDVSFWCIGIWDMDTCFVL